MKRQLPKKLAAQVDRAKYGKPDAHSRRTSYFYIQGFNDGMRLLNIYLGYPDGDELVKRIVKLIGEGHELDEACAEALKDR